MGEVHANGGGFVEDGEGAGGVEFRAEAEGVVGEVAGAEHPLVAGEAADALADLVGEGLEGEAAVGGGEGAAEGGAGEAGGEEFGDGLFKAAGADMFDGAEGDEGRGGGGGADGEAMEGGEKDEGADAVVEIRGVLAEGFEAGGFGEEVGERAAGGPLFKGGVGTGLDAVDEGHRAVSSSMRERISSRSAPWRPRASWAWRRPYLLPISKRRPGRTVAR